MLEEGSMKQSKKLAVLRDCRVLFEAGSFSGLSDGELLAQFVKREADTAEMAFAVLVERHAGAVMRICRAIVRNEHDAEDAFQATFLVLAAKAGRLRVRESLRPWLGAVSRRVARCAGGRAGSGSSRITGGEGCRSRATRAPKAAKSRRLCMRKSIVCPSDIGCRCCSATWRAILD